MALVKQDGDSEGVNMSGSTTFDIQKSIKAQRDYCNEKGYPYFAPNDGVCWRCHRNIYQRIEHKADRGNSYCTGISTEEAGKFHITGCPHCNKSFCD